MSLSLDQILKGFKKVDKSTTSSKIVPVLLSSVGPNSNEHKTDLYFASSSTQEPLQFEISSSFFRAFSNVRFKFEIEIQLLLIVVLGLLSVFLTVSIIFKIFCLSHFFPKKPKKRHEV